MNVNDINRSAVNGLNAFFAFLPQLLGALIIFIIGWMVASALKNIVTRALAATGFDSTLLGSSAGGMVKQIFHRPSVFVGKVVYWLVFLAGLSMALSSLNVTALNAFLGTVYGYLPHVIASVGIFLVSGMVSVAAVAFVNRVMGETPLAKTIATIIPSIVMSIAVFMILNELQIAPAIVSITYTALVGSIALGMALAFGLGGRDVAAQILNQAYEKGQQNAAQARTELRQAAATTREEMGRKGRQARR